VDEALGRRACPQDHGGSPDGGPEKAAAQGRAEVDGPAWATSITTRLGVERDPVLAAQLVAARPPSSAIPRQQAMLGAAYLARQGRGARPGAGAALGWSRPRAGGRGANWAAGFLRQARGPDMIVGTAGHIDHGKTALVKALTGGRLPTA